MKVIWKHLSEDEPENQKPPENIEQLIEMLSREGARRFVHVTNFIVKNIYMTPKHVGHAFTYIVNESVAITVKINRVSVRDCQTFYKKKSIVMYLFYFFLLSGKFAYFDRFNSVWKRI